MAEYDLKLVKEAARNGNIEYRGLKVSTDIANLGYEFSDVCNCLMLIDPSDFDKTHTYANSPPYDSYICRYKKNVDEELFDELYIKFCLFDDYLEIDLASFHLTQF